MGSGSSDWGQVEHSGDLYSQTDRDLARNSKAKTPSLQRLKKEDRENTNMVARGMGETGLTRRYLTDVEKMGMCLLRGQGLTNEEIAEKTKRPVATVANVFRQVEKASAAAGLNYDWKAVVRQLAVDGLKYGLTKEEDPAKRGTLSLNTLKATGDLLSDNTLDIARLVNGIPAGMESRYILISPEPPAQIEESTDDLPPTA